ncbi:hypothetical protein FHW15_001063 [Terracoccus luteus]|uniref:Uncharacterized protein n=1 Tax=Terracoccus luteus TaxID=53356 RepID=A0A839PS63_9MICO|nr:hypothetical protein [Terracoccus luteus]MCP2171571.1 hypothetical protein [Terracoccus luteus]
MRTVATQLDHNDQQSSALSGKCHRRYTLKRNSTTSPSAMT